MPFLILDSSGKETTLVCWLLGLAWPDLSQPRRISVCPRALALCLGLPETLKAKAEEFEAFMTSRDRSQTAGCSEEPLDFIVVASGLSGPGQGLPGPGFPGHRLACRGVGLCEVGWTMCGCWEPCCRPKGAAQRKGCFSPFLEGHLGHSGLSSLGLFARSPSTSLVLPAGPRVGLF